MSAWQEIRDLITGRADKALADREDLPAESVGRQLAFLLRRTWFETHPAPASLRDAAE